MCSSSGAEARNLPAQYGAAEAAPCHRRTSCPRAPTRLELHCDILPLSRGVELEKLSRLETEHTRDNVAGKGLHFGVEVAHDRVVVAASFLQRVLDLVERILQRLELLVRLQLRICFG